MTKKIISFLLLTIFSIFIPVNQADAKVLPQSSSAKSAPASKTTTSSGIGVSVKFRGDKKAVILNFSNLQNANSVNCVLTYTQNGQEEGAIGSLTLGKSQTATQELLFGTCSKNVCRYHSNISNVKLEASYTLKSGKKYIKRYKIKI